MNLRTPRQTIRRTENLQYLPPTEGVNINKRKVKKKKRSICRVERGIVTPTAEGRKGLLTYGDLCGPHTVTLYSTANIPLSVPPSGDCPHVLRQKTGPPRARVHTVLLASSSQAGNISDAILCAPLKDFGEQFIHTIVTSRITGINS